MDLAGFLLEVLADVVVGLDVIPAQGSGPRFEVNPEVAKAWREQREAEGRIRIKRSGPGSKRDDILSAKEVREILNGRVKFEAATATLRLMLETALCDGNCSDEELVFVVNVARNLFKVDDAVAIRMVHECRVNRPATVGAMITGFNSGSSALDRLAAFQCCAAVCFRDGIMSDHERSFMESLAFRLRIRKSLAAKLTGGENASVGTPPKRGPRKSPRPDD